MPALEKVIKTSRLFNSILSISVLATIGAFVWLGIAEMNSVQEMRHIVTSDMQQIELQLQNNALSAEAALHLSNKIQNSHITFTMITVASLLLSLTWLLTLLHYRRLKNLKLTQQRLAELMYYDQVLEMHAAPQTQAKLPPAFKELQLNLEFFMSELQRALTNNEFKLYYQPIIDLESDKIFDVEALIRWQHPVYGLLSPDVFLPLCENNGFIIPLGEWILQTACQQIRKWHELGFPKLCISVNLSARQLNDPNLLTLITTALQKNFVSHHSLKLEITENSLIKDIEGNIELLKSLRDLGLQLSLDDFGTGYSSLNYLKQIPVNNIKIDKTFIHDITNNITSFAIVESVMVLGRSLGLSITAEGVETKDQLHMLKKMKCDYVQGYFYSKPITAEEFTCLLMTTHKRQTKTNVTEATDIHPYRYELLKQEHFDQVVNVITQAFCTHEPMTHYLGIKAEEFTAFAKLMVNKAIQDGLSMVAMQDDKVSACTIVEDIAEPLNISVDIDPRFKVIFSLLENLGSDFFKERQLQKGQVAHLFITAVDKHSQNKGLSRKINFESIQLAKDKGFDFMCCEFTHNYNEKGTVKNLKNNRLLIRSCVYKEFTYEGKKPFENLEGTASAYIWELRDGAKLTYQIN